MLFQPEDAPEALAARQEMRDHPLVRGLLADLSAWPAPRLNSHKSAGHPLHELSFLAWRVLERMDSLASDT